jgi:2-phospho-L-lactate guanylyltransferase (CobY/MobA/RfbA family)
MITMMQGLSDDERKQVLGEVLMDELKAISEYVQVLPIIQRDVEQLKLGVGELKDDMKVVKAAVTDQSRQLADHEARLTRLENAA